MINNYTFLPSIISWKWIDKATPQTLEKHLQSPKVNLTTLLGYGALKRYTNNRLSEAVDLCGKFIEYLPEEKYVKLNSIFNDIEKDNLFPQLLSQAIEKHSDTQSKNLITLQGTFTPEQFYGACTRQLYKTAELMLRREANPNQSNSAKTSTVLHYAAAHQDEELLDLLLSFDADVNVQDEHGYTPMHWALATDNLSILQKLFAKGADVSIPNNKGETVVAMALTYNKRPLRKAVAYLFKDFSYIFYHIQDEPMHTVIDTIKSDPQKYIFQHDIGANPLEVPVLLNDQELAQFVRRSLSEEKYQEYLAKIQEQYPRTTLRIFSTHA